MSEQFTSPEDSAVVAASETSSEPTQEASDSPSPSSIEPSPLDSAVDTSSVEVSEPSADTTSEPAPEDIALTEDDGPFPGPDEVEPDGDAPLGRDVDGNPVTGEDEGGDISEEEAARRVALFEAAEPADPTEPVTPSSEPSDSGDAGEVDVDSAAEDYSFDEGGPVELSEGDNPYAHLPYPEAQRLGLQFDKPDSWPVDSGPTQEATESPLTVTETGIVRDNVGREDQSVHEDAARERDGVTNATPEPVAPEVEAQDEASA